jgi:hypothetical protein
MALTLSTVALSGASYIAPSANPANVFTTGTLLHSNSQDGSVVITAGNMAPGDSSMGTMTLTGSGTLAGAYTLAASGLSDIPDSPGLSHTLSLTVEDITGAPQTLFTGPVSSFSTAALGTIAPGASRTYRLTLSYPAGTNVAALQGASMSVVLGVTGVSQ